MNPTHPWTTGFIGADPDGLARLRARLLDAGAAVAFLGGAPSADRLRTYAALRPLLSPGARARWDAAPDAVARGVLSAGVTERFIAAVAWVVRHAVHPAARVRRLLACRTLDEQRAFYAREWDTRRWRLLFRLLLNRAVFNRAYDPAFFRLVENPSFAAHFHRLVGHGLTELPVRANYFLHHMLTGRYPAGEPDGVPPYLAPAGVARIAARLAAPGAALTLVDGSYTAYLRTLPDRSVHAFALSNVCEWLTPPEIDALFAEVARTAVPGARLCFRNFVGWTELPERWRERVVEDRARGAALSRRDRSLVQPRIAVCRIGGGAP